MAIKPEDILADNQDVASFNQVSIRKGSIAAALANVEIMLSAESSADEKSAATEMFITLVKQIQKTVFAKHLAWKHPIIKKIVEENCDD